MAMSLQESVKAAVTSLEGDSGNNGDNGDTGNTSGDEGNNSTNTADPENSGSEEVVEIEASAEEINQSLEMYRTLNDPQKAKEFIQSLAKQVGVEIAGTKVTPAAATETVLDILRSELGEENSELAERLAPALEKLISKQVQKPIETLQVEQKIKEAKLEIDQVFDKLGKELPDFNNEDFQKKMSNVMKTVQPAQGISMENYMRTIYKLADGKPAKTSTTTTSSSTNSNNRTTVKTVVNKMIKNAQEARTTVSSNAGNDDGVTKSPQKLSARQAVLQAVSELQGKKN